MTLTPAQLCRGLLDALDASEGRRKRRARDTTPDAIGLAIQREILDAAVRDAPAAEEFEQWLLSCSLAQGAGEGPHRAMALSIWNEWRLASSADDVARWLITGAPSEDKEVNN